MVVNEQPITCMREQSAEEKQHPRIEDYAMEFVHWIHNLESSFSGRKTPRGIILCGRLEKAGRAEIEAAARNMLNQVPIVIKNKLPAPYAPCLNVSIAKLRARPGALRATALALQKWMDDNSKESMPAWCVVEQSPEQGARRSRIKGGMAIIRSLNIQGLDMCLSSGDIVPARNVMAKLKFGAEQWQKLEGRGTVVQAQWDQVLAALSAA